MVKDRGALRAPALRAVAPGEMALDLVEEIVGQTRLDDVGVASRVERLLDGRAERLTLGSHIRRPTHPVYQAREMETRAKPATPGKAFHTASSSEPAIDADRQK